MHDPAWVTYNVGSCNLSFDFFDISVQRLVKERTLGCANSPPTSRGSQETGFTQPSDRSFAQPCFKPEGSWPRSELGYKYNNEAKGAALAQAVRTHPPHHCTTPASHHTCEVKHACRVRDVLSVGRSLRRNTTLRSRHRFYFIPAGL